MHAAIPATIVYKASGGNILLSIVAGALGTIPDIFNNKYYHLLPIDRLYNKLHRPWLWLKSTKLAILLTCYALLWPIGLHVAMDYDFHTDSDGMKNVWEMVMIEIVCWGLLLCWWWAL